MRAIMLAFSCQQPYHALRAAATGGYTVHVVGRDGARGLKYSRSCATYHHFDFDPVTQSLNVALAEISRVVKELSADIILPSDIISARLLVALKGRLPVPASVLPDPACFDMLNDKWQFYRFCKDHGVRVPQSWLFEDTDALKAAIAEGSVPFPFIIKPLDSSGGFGVHRIMGKSDLKIIDDIRYKLVLAQKLIVGEDIDISVLANKGRIGAYAVQRNLPGKYLFIRNDKLLVQASRVVEASGFHGLAHFDAILEKETGDVYLIECNPRAWLSLFASTVAGLNFVKMSLNAEAPDPVLCLVDKEVDNSGSTIKLFVKLITNLSTNKPDWNLLKYNLADPVGKKCSRLKRFDNMSSAGYLEYQASALKSLRATQTDAGR